MKASVQACLRLSLGFSGDSAVNRHGGTRDRIFAGWNSHRGHGVKWNAPEGMDSDGLILGNGSNRGARLKKFGKDGSGVRGLIGAGFTFQQSTGSAGCPHKTDNSLTSRRTADPGRLP